MFFFRLCKFFMYLPFVILYPTKIIGKKYLKTVDGEGNKKGAVLVSNHTSNIDSLLFACHMKEPNYYLAKKELFSNKFKSWILRHIGCIKIDRQENDIGAIKTCVGLLKKGKKLVVFPEGTRNHNEDMELGEIKGGAAMLAIKTKVPVIPIYINRTPKIFRKTIVTIGEPFEFTEFYNQRLDSETLNKAGNILADKMNELRSKVVQQQNNKKTEKKCKKSSANA